MNISEISCSTALSPSKLPGLTYSLNPYRGCQHNCAYCYVPNILRVPRKQWGQFVQIKRNIPIILSKELKKKPIGTIGLATVTDPYQPIEQTKKLTQYCLEQLIRYEFPVSIQTKSALIIRDLKLISQLSQAELIFSIGTLDDRQRILLEPNSSSIHDRLTALQMAHDQGIKTMVFFGPIYPTIQPKDLPDIIRCFKDHGADKIMVDHFNEKPGMTKEIIHRIEKKNLNEVYTHWTQQKHQWRQEIDYQVKQLHNNDSTIIAAFPDKNKKKT